MCVTAFCVANAPGIAAAVGGLAAAKVALNQRDAPARPGGRLPAQRPLSPDTPAVARVVVERKELPPLLCSREEH